MAGAEIFSGSVVKSQGSYYASKQISRSEMVAHEEPWATLRENLTAAEIMNALPSSRRIQFNNLPIRSTLDPQDPTARFKSNRLRQATQASQATNGTDNIVWGIFPGLTSLSSSCSPNLHPHWNSTQRRMQLRAVDDIPQGAELTISYDVEGLLLYRNDRRDRLLRNFGIDCSCYICNGSAAEVTASNQRRGSILPVVNGRVGPLGMPPTKNQLEQALDSLQRESLYICRDTLSYDIYKRCLNNAMLYPGEEKARLDDAIRFAVATVGENDGRVRDMRRRAQVYPNQ